MTMKLSLVLLVLLVLLLLGLVPAMARAAKRQWRAAADLLLSTVGCAMFVSGLVQDSTTLIVAGIVLVGIGLATELPGYWRMWRAR